jgi:hypothetical protein
MGYELIHMFKLLAFMLVHFHIFEGMMDSKIHIKKDIDERVDFK